MITLSEMDDVLEHAPKDPGPIATGLVGWRRANGDQVCAHCAGRLFGRGFHHLFAGWASIWNESEFACFLLRNHEGRS